MSKKWEAVHLGEGPVTVCARGSVGAVAPARPIAYDGAPQRCAAAPRSRPQGGPMTTEATSAEKSPETRAVITVLGSDRPGIVAAVAGALSEREANILDISQTILQGIFTMTMLVDLALRRLLRAQGLPGGALRGAWRADRRCSARRSSGSCTGSSPPVPVPVSHLYQVQVGRKWDTGRCPPADRPPKEGGFHRSEFPRGPAGPSSPRTRRPPSSTSRTRTPCPPWGWVCRPSRTASTTATRRSTWCRASSTPSTTSSAACATPTARAWSRASRRISDVHGYNKVDGKVVPDRGQAHAIAATSIAGSGQQSPKGRGPLRLRGSRLPAHHGYAAQRAKSSTASARAWAPAEHLSDELRERVPA